MPIKRFFIALAFGVFAGSASAQTTANGYVLWPIALPGPTTGAFGSVWRTELWGHNAGSAPFGVHLNCTPKFEGDLECFVFFPGLTLQVPDSDAANGDFEGILMYVGPDGLRNGSFTSRLIETSQHAQPLGVEIPVVRETEFFTRPVRFVAIPAAATARVALRVYDTDPVIRRLGGSAKIDILRPDGSVVVSRNIAFRYFIALDDRKPGVIQIYDLTAAFPEIFGLSRYDIVVTPLKSGGMRYYALVSVTDNATQQVVIVTAREPVQLTP